jgi:hypothetical protein
MEDQIDPETREKQMYLKSEIIEGGFDVDMFVEYMDAIRENGNLFFNHFILKVVPTSPSGP